MPTPSPISPVAIAAQEDPGVQAAMRQIAAGAEELNRALEALGAAIPRLSAVLPRLGPVLAAQAIHEGRTRTSAHRPDEH